MQKKRLILCIALLVIGLGAAQAQTVIAVTQETPYTTVLQAGETHSFTVTVTRAGTYTAKTRGAIQLTLHNAAGEQLASAYEGYGNEEIRANLAPGTYTLDVAAYSWLAAYSWRSGEVEYTLSVEQPVGTTTLHYLTVPLAVITPGTPIRLDIERGRFHWYTVTVANPGLFTVYTEGEVSPPMWLFNAAGDELVALSGGSSYSGSSEIQIYVPAETYILRVENTYRDTPLTLHVIAPTPQGQIVGTVAQGRNIAEKLDWLKAFAQSNGSYVIEVNANETITNIGFSYGDKRHITITLRGIGSNRTITGPGGSERGISIGSGVILVLENNITIQRMRVYVDKSGILVMNDGASITGGYRVDIAGTFIMNGGTISNNSVDVGMYGTFTMNGGAITGNSGPGVRVGGTFTMNGGTISGNSGGGIIVEDTFIMKGGTITGNTSSSGGGGVRVNGSIVSFTKTGGTITGYSSDSRNGNAVKNSAGAVQNFRGHAVFVGTGQYDGNETIKIKDSTAGPADNLLYMNDWNRIEKEVAIGAWDN